MCSLWGGDNSEFQLRFHWGVGHILTTEFSNMVVNIYSFLKL